MVQRIAASYGWSLWTALLLPFALPAQSNTNVVTREQAQAAQTLIGLDFPDGKLDMMLPDLKEQRERFEALRKFPLSNSVPPALLFNPLPVGMQIPSGPARFRSSPPGRVRLPDKPDDLAYYSVTELGVLLKKRQLTSEQLTRFCIERIKRYGPRLECIVSLMEDQAVEQARLADQELARGRYRGPLHGIPYAAKDLLAARGARTTWGAGPYTNQVFDFDATVIQKLAKAGAVLVAKTTLGELAMGEVWYGGKTRNPWNLQEGSSGSSAGSCAGTAAGLFPFAIGSETYGSIVSPCDRCGVTGLRPTYGRVSRTGAMTLSWTMDKIGPVARTVEDCALVFNAICGPDGIDQTVYNASFNYDARLDVKKLRVGCLQKDFESEKGERKDNDAATLAKLRELGIKLTPVELPGYPLSIMSFGLSTEAAAAFDDLTRSGRDDLLKQQGAGDWANTFRQKRFVPAVEYLQAQRVRYLLIQDTAKLFEKVDVLLAPSFAGKALLLGNLTGHPCVVLPNGFSKEGTPTSICFIGKLFGEGEALALAKHYQDATAFHRKHPPLE